MEFDKRIPYFCEWLNQAKIDVAILFDRANVRYFSAFRMNRATNSILIIKPTGDTVFVVPLLDYQRALKKCSLDQIIHFPEDVSDYLSVIKEPLSGIKVSRVGVELSIISYSQMKYLSQLFGDEVEFVDVTEMLGNMRMVKCADEITAIRKAAQIADQAIEEVIKKAREGDTEFEMTAYAKYIMGREGAEGESFEPFMMSGENAWLPQRISSSKKLVKGELILLDIGAVFEGYCSDLTRTFSLGGLSNKAREIFQVAYEAQQRAIEVLKPGIRGEEIDQVARNFITQAGFGKYFPHLTGHGLGLEDHEAPLLDKGSKIELVPGMVLTVEPGIYVPEIGAARVEDMVLITENGYEILTKVERELV